MKYLHGPFATLAKQVRDKRLSEARRERLRELSRGIRALESQAIEIGVSQVVLARLLDARTLLDLAVAEGANDTASPQ